MKKVFLLLFVSFLLTAPPVFAQQDTIFPLVTPTPIPQLPAEYVLPYPGLLPDNTLYPLKVFRDRVIGFMVSNTVKKSEFDLLQADKRLAASVYLLKENPVKEQLIISTLSKAENYFEQAIASAREGKSQGMDITEVAKKMQLSRIKHEKTLGEIAKKTSKDTSPSIVALQERVKGFTKDVLLLTPPIKNK